jgi:hypothetical protein
MWCPGFKRVYISCTYVRCFVVPTKNLFCFDILPWEHLNIREGRMPLYMWPWHCTLSQGPTNFPKIQDYLPNSGCQKDDLMNITYLTGVMLERHSYVVICVWCLWTGNILWCKGKDAIITLKILGTTIQNAFNHVVGHLGFVHFCPHLFLWNWNWVLNGLESGRAYENTGVCNHQALVCPDTRWGYEDQNFLESYKNMGSFADSMEQINWEMDNLSAGW